MAYALTLIGAALLFVGGESLVRGAVALAERVGISKLLVGMTIVAAGTSMPEMVVSVSASLRGSTGVAVGNVVGSNICNVLLILGVSAAIRPVLMDPAQVRRDLKMFVGSALALVLLTVAFGQVGRLSGALLLSVLVVYVVRSYRLEMAAPSPAGELFEEEVEQFEGVGTEAKSAWPSVLLVALGVATLVCGSNLLVTGATDIARMFGVSETVIGLTLVALGTSLPELATSAIAAARGHSDVAVGNVVGSNIFNILAILGVAGLIKPLAIPEQIAQVDIWVMLAVTLLAAIPAWRGRLGRRWATVSLVGYVGYIVASYL